MSGGIGPLSNLPGKVNANNELVVAASVSVSGADGSILDGADSLIKATVKDLSNSNPLAVAIMDGSGDQITSFGGGTQYTEDQAAAANPVGTVPIMVRADTPAAVTTTDGDNIGQRATNYGAAYVQIVSSSGAFVDTFGGGTQYDQGTASTDTDVLTMAGVERRDTPAVPTGVADGDRTMPAVDSEGVLWTRLRQQIDADTGGGTVATDVVVLGLPASGGPVAAIGGAGAVSSQVQRTTLASDDPAVTALQVIDDWDESDRAKVNLIVGQAGIAGGTGVDGATVPRVTLATNVALPAGTNAIGQVTAVGTVADDSTTPGAPVMVGGFAKSMDGTDPSSVAENDVARFITDLNRRIYTNTIHPRFGHKHLNGSSAYTDESIVADPGDGFQIVITNIIASTGAATALNFFLEEGSTTIFGPIYLEAVNGRGFASGPIALPVTASTAVTLTSSAAIAQSYDIDYFIQAV